MTSGSPGAQENRSPDSQQWPTTTYLPVSAEGVFLSTTIGCCAPYLTRQNRAEQNVLGTLIVSGANMVKCQKGNTQPSYLGIHFNSMHTSNEQKHDIRMYKFGWTVLSDKKGCHDMRWIMMLMKGRCYRTSNSQRGSQHFCHATIQFDECVASWSCRDNVLSRAGMSIGKR